MAGKRIAIEWQRGQPCGSIEVFHGRLAGGRIAKGQGRWTGSEVEADIRRRGLRTLQQRIEAEPEESYEQACSRNRNPYCPIGEAQ
jgi:hypothetical protein